MTPARPLAVLFDLWGTLVAPRPERRDAVSRAIAYDLGVDPPAFLAAIPGSHAKLRRLDDLPGSPWLGLPSA